MTALSRPKNRPLPVGQVISVLRGTNADAFKRVYGTYMSHCKTIADVTFAHGMFWRDIDLKKVLLVTSDLRPLPSVMQVTDCANLVHIKKGGLDGLVLDPPFMTGGKSDKSVFASRYSTTTVEKLLAMFDATNREFARVLRPGGVFVLKIQDIVSGGRQHWLHMEARSRYTNFYLKDLFVYHFTDKPFFDARGQQHARKVHAYFMVFLKL